MPKQVTSKQEIIDICIDLFSRYGYAGVSIKQITDVIGISKASIYHYFDTKEEILVNCAINYTEELSQCISAFEIPKYWIPEFYKKKLETGCFMFNMMACQDSLLSLKYYVANFLGMIDLTLEKKQELIGCLLWAKDTQYSRKRFLDKFIKSLED